MIPIPLGLNRQIKRPPILLKVYQVKAKSGLQSYNIIFDCLNILKTAMGRPDQPEDSISDDLRRRNLNDFRDFLELNLFPSHRLATNMRIPIRIVEFTDNNWFNVDGNPSEDYPDLLADVIIEHFERDLAEGKYSDGIDGTDGTENDTDDFYSSSEYDYHSD